MLALSARSTTCPACGGVKSPRAAQCQRCHLTAIAPLGFAATARKYGHDFAVTFVKAHLDSHPSNLEQIVAGWLDDLAVEYMTNWRVIATRQGKKVNYLVDFVAFSPNMTLVIEVDGEWAHQFHHDRDKHKHLILSRRFGKHNVLHLTDTSIASGDARKSVEAALARCHASPQ